MRSLVILALLLTTTVFTTIGSSIDPVQQKKVSGESPQSRRKSDASDVVYLDDLKERAFEVSYGTLGKRGSTGYPANDVQRCRLNLGRGEVSHGLSISPNAQPSQPATAAPITAVPPAHVIYDLGKRYHTFRGLAAINYPVAEDGLQNAKKEGWKGASESPVKFRVIGDGKLLWESMNLQKHGETQECEVVIADVAQLRLEVVCEGSMRFAWSFWAFPRVTLKQQAIVAAPIPLAPIPLAPIPLAPIPLAIEPKPTEPNAPAPVTVIAAESPSPALDDQKEAASPKELATQLTEKAGLLAKKMVFAGKVAKATPQAVYLTMGEGSGIRVGNSLSVFRSMGEIKDPVTGAVLGTERPLISHLEVTEVNANYSKAKIVSKLEAQIEIGDEVESKNEMSIAVCPICDEEGRISNKGSTISEEITTKLVEAGFKVVERSVLEPVVGELIRQNTLLFETKTAQKIGELSGATYVVIGKIVTENETGKAFVRLVNVASGEIALATSAVISPASASDSKVTTNSDEMAKLAPATGKPAANDAGNLANGLPSFLTTTSLFKRVQGKAIRLQGLEQGSIRTKENGFLNKDFTFEVVVTLKPEDRFASIGLGAGIPDRSYNGLKDSVYVRLHSKKDADGEVKLEKFALGSESFGRVASNGPHLVRIIKEGDKVVFQVDVGNDGPSDDDLETTVLNIREFVPFFHSKNMNLFFGGHGDFVSASLKKP